MDTWVRHRGEGRPLELWACRRGEDLVALLPMVRSGGELRFAGHGESDQLGPVCAPEHLEEAWLAVAELPCDRLVADDVPAADPLPASAEILTRTPTPVVDLRNLASWDDFLARRSPNFRRQVREREGRLERDRQAVFGVTNSPVALEADLEAFLALHDMRWEGSSASFAGSRRDLHRDFAKQALDRGWLRLHTLELDGEPTAALLNFRYGDAEWHYQAGRDPARKREALGFVLHTHAIRGALEDGLAEYRLLRGGEPYKDRFATHDPGLVTFAL